MKNKKINYNDVVEILQNEDGIMQEPDAGWLLDYMATEYGGNLDNTSSWAQGREGLLIYTETTADSYDVYACTSEHNGPRDFGNDVYYYADHVEFSERAIDTLCNGRDVWIADHVWDELEYDFNYELEQWWSDVYEDLHSEKVDELIDIGYEYDE
jgi:hypothetical protein|tara:strand:- start:101 stop:565 length:465 start_codon:yes stop_codon:yes gene_type:complete